MSEIISKGVALATCAAAASLVVKASRACYETLTWLASSAQREVARLEQELAMPVPEFATTEEARKAFQGMLARAKTLAAERPLLREHSEAIARVVALKHSPLNMFVSEAQWQNLSQSPVSKRSFHAILGQAAKSLTIANAQYVRASIMDVAQRAGFTQQRRDHTRNGTQTLVLEDSDGRALVAQIGASEQGATLNLDLTGFGDHSCHGVMDSLVQGLADKNIRLGHIERRSHYRREGVLLSTADRQAQEKTASAVNGAEKHRESEAQRRRTHFATRQLKLTQ